MNSLTYILFVSSFKNSCVLKILNIVNSHLYKNMKEGIRICMVGEQESG